MFVVTGAAATGRRLWKSAEGPFGTIVDQQGKQGEKYGWVKNQIKYALGASVHFLSNPYILNTPGKTRQPVQSGTRITKAPDAQPRIKWHQHQNERSDSTLTTKEEKLPK